MGPEGRTADRGKWLALTAALLGWLFDGAEMGIFSMVGRPAVRDLLRTSDDKVIGLWFGVVIAGFLVGAATGGVLFGWLGDRIGRVRAMSLSVLTYSLFTGACAFVTEAWQLGALRFVASLGMGGEWALGVALVMEVWPDRSRAFLAGLIGAAANVGYMLVGFAGLGLNALLAGFGDLLGSLGLSTDTVAWLTAYSGWRLMMAIGTLPALLTFFFRLFVPESERWREEQRRGATSGWAARDLLGVVAGVLGPAVVVYLWAADHSLGVRLAGSLAGLVVAAVGYTYPVIRYLQRQAGGLWRPTARRMLLGAALSGVALLGTWGSTQWAPSWAAKLVEGTENAPPAKEWTQIAMATGAVLGTIAAALAGDWLGRRWAYFLLCLGSLGAVLLLFQGNREFGSFFLFSAFVAGGVTASFYGWLPLYLPELFPTRVRATGQGFGFNFGRILAAIGALQTGVLFSIDIPLGSYELEKGYPSACSVMGLIYLVGMAVIWLAPETRGKPLPE